ncbi:MULTISPECIES: hypothetical protein [unclassified Streptomyces]|uniref:hypothetical protein n=1 Tax=unclassified Streptomyces TaxID=2593676 RepID=UPI000933B2D5|nr:hypothetical protein [Streptomyces sp. NBRC 110465]
MRLSRSPRRGAAAGTAASALTAAGLLIGPPPARAHRSVLLLTHRLTNVAVADRIVVLDQGRIVQEGTYAQLTQQTGLFRTLWELQRRMSDDTPWAVRFLPEAGYDSVSVVITDAEHLPHRGWRRADSTPPWSPSTPGTCRGPTRPHRLHRHSHPA